MSILSTLTTDENIADEKDFVGGNGPLDSGLYTATVESAYIEKSQGGALGLVLNLKTNAGQYVRQTLWMASGNAKGNKNYFEDRNGQKQYLPGFTHANSLALLTVGKEIGQLDTETKVMNVYNFEAKSEVPTKVEMVMDLVGQEVIVGLIKQTVDKNALNQTSGKYEPTGETREENEIDKIFRASDRMTTAEIRAQAEEAVFVDTWNEKWAGKVRDRAKGASKGLAGVPKMGNAPAAAAASKPTTSLFG